MAIVILKEDFSSVLTVIDDYVQPRRSNDVNHGSYAPDNTFCSHIILTSFDVENTGADGGLELLAPRHPCEIPKLEETVET